MCRNTMQLKHSLLDAKEDGVEGRVRIERIVLAQKRLHFIAPALSEQMVSQ